MTPFNDRWEGQIIRTQKQSNNIHVAPCGVSVRKRQTPSERVRMRDSERCKKVVIILPKTHIHSRPWTRAQRARRQEKNTRNCALDEEANHQRVQQTLSNSLIDLLILSLSPFPSPSLRHSLGNVRTDIAKQHSSAIRIVILSWERNIAKHPNKKWHRNGP